MRKQTLLASTIALVAALLLSGCTPAEPETRAVGGQSSASGSPSPTNGAGQAETTTAPTLASTGEFVSQATATVGTATLVENPDHSITLTLSDFSTDARLDIRMYLNSDPVVLDADGFYKVIDGPSSTGHLEIGHLSSATGDQTYDLTTLRQSLRSTHSLTLYDYAAREDLGSVNIGPIG